MSFARRRKIIAIALAGFFVFGTFSTVPLAAQAQVTTVLGDVQRTAGEFLLDILGGVVRNALNAVLGKLAYDAAVFISSGGKGQDSLVFSQPPGEYFSDVGDAAVGGVIEGVAEGAGLNAAGLCDPGPQFRVGLTVSLGDLAKDFGDIKERQYYKPACTLTELGGNWKEAFDNTDFSKFLDLQFDTTGNPLGISLEVQNTAIIAIAEAEKEAEIERLKGDFKDKVSTVSQTILTPSATIEHELEGATDASKRTFDTVGKPFTDAIGIFSTTLVSRLMKLLQDGLANSQNPSSLGALVSGSRTQGSRGRQAAQARFAEIRQPIFAATGSFDILGELGSCPDQETQRKVNNCAIGSRMALAITEGWTVQQFVDSLEGSDGFRFADDSLTSADIENGVTYRGIILMKKYRIVPVGWQLAAEYARLVESENPPSLQELVDAYDNCGADNYSPYCGLIDPTWVFKVPQNFCTREAPSFDLAIPPQILDHDGRSNTQEQVLFNRLNSCADSRGCIQEEQEGICTAYGYCTEEERIYRFAGEVCEESYSSCQTFTDSDGNDQSFVKSSLNYNDCATDPGCQWYCLSTNASGQYNCASPTETYISCSEDVANNEADYGLLEESLNYELNESCSCTTARTCEVQAGSDLGYDAPPGDGVFDYWQCEVTNDLDLDGDGLLDTSLCELDDPCGAGNPNFDPGSGTCTCSIQETCSENAGDANCQTPNGNTCVIDEDNDTTADICSADLNAYSSAPVCAPTTGNDLYCGTCTVPFGQSSCTTELGNTWTITGLLSYCVNPAGCPHTIRDTCSLASGAFSCTSATGNVCILGTQVENPQVDNDTMYFDDNAQFCDAEDAGCNQYIRVLPNTNLIPNAFFEYFDTDQNTLDDENSDFVGFCTHDGSGCFNDTSCYEDADGDGPGDGDGDGIDDDIGSSCVGWEQTLINARLLTGTFSASISPNLGDNYLRMTTDSVGDGSLDTYINTGRDLYNRTFTLAYRALSQQADLTTCNLAFTIGDANGNEVDAVIESNEPDENGNPITAYTSDWRDYVHTITFPDEDNYGGSGESGTTIKISIAESQNCEIDIDGAMLLESDEFPGSYANYAEANVTQLNGDTLSCSPEDVGCELYVQEGRKDKDGVPGIITNPDSNACVGTCTSNPLLDEATCPIADWDNTAYNYSNPQCSQCTGNEDADQDPDHYEGCGFFQEVSLDTTAPITEDFLFLAPPSDDWNGVVKRYGGRCSDDNSVHCFNDTNCDPLASCDLQLSLIPKTANQCALSQVGCEEYTNLDTVAQGGEGLEYYTQLKQCVKTDDPEIETYFTFEGSDTEGIQIVEHLLKQEPTTGAPCTSLNPQSEDFNAECNDQDADSDGVLDSDCGPASDDDAYGIDSPNFDPDCRQYLNSIGDVFYRYESQVVEASESCIPLRNSLDTRIYYGIPQLSNACAPEANGCREYRGTNAANEREIIDESFVLNSTEDWTGATSTSNESLAELDYSLQLHDADTSNTDNVEITYDLFTDTGTEINGDLTPGASYTLTFWAKVVADATATFMIDGADADYYFTTTGSETNNPGASVTLDPNDEGGWQYYQLGPVILDTEEDFDQVGVTFTMQMEGGANDTEAFVDNIRLTESNSQFLIQDTFEYCQGFEGCREYTDRGDNIHYLKSFVRLCGESVVGCELMLDTHNSTFPFTEAFNNDNEYDQDDVIVPADAPTTLVYDEDNECAQSAYGCTAVGLPDEDERTGQVREFTKTYVLNRPDDYIQILCEQPQLQCRQYTSDFDGTVYFKDPGDRLCSLKQFTNEAGNLVNGWFKKGSLSDTPDCPVQHPQADPSQPLGGVCNSNSVSHAADGTIINNKVGKLCNQDADCYPSGWSSGDPAPRCISRLADDVDVFDGNVHQYQVRTDDNITLADEAIDFGWSGQCPDEQSGCSEYVDPYSPNISEINKNWSFEDDVRGVGSSLQFYESEETPDGYPDYWQYVPNVTPVATGETDSEGAPILEFTEFDIEGDDTVDFYTTCSATSVSAIQTNSSAYSGSAVNAADGANTLKLTNCLVQQSSTFAIAPDKLYTIRAMVKFPEEDAFGDAEFSIGLRYYNEAGQPLTLDDGVTPEQIYVVADHLTIQPTAFETDEVDNLSTWYLIQGNIGLGSTVTFPGNAHSARMFIANHSGDPLYFDAASVKQNDKYYYLDYTVDGTSEKEQQSSTNSCFNQDADQAQITSDGGCVAFRDITFDAQNYSQDALDCASCLLTPNADSCRGIIDACDTNTVLKVKKDRVCSEWVGCRNANLVESEDGTSASQCFTLDVCVALDENGQCKTWKPKPPYSRLNPNSDINFSSAPGDANELTAARNLTGYVKAGLTWTQYRVCDSGPYLEGGPDDGFCNEDLDCWDDEVDPVDTSPQCLPPLNVQGYYPYGWMYEVGINGAEQGEELIEHSTFEELFCAGSLGDSTVACVTNPTVSPQGNTAAAGHCFTSNLEQKLNAEPDTDINDLVYIGTSSDFGSGNASKAFCPNSPDFDSYWPFGKGGKYTSSGWRQFPEDSGRVFINQHDTTGSIDCVSDDANVECAGVDINNVLQFQTTADSSSPFSAGVQYDLEDNIVPSGSYALSFDGRFVGGGVEAGPGTFNPSSLTICLVHANMQGADGNELDRRDCFVSGYGMADIVFAIDSSNSMSDQIAAVKTAVPALATQLSTAGIDSRFALIDMDYKDLDGDQVSNSNGGYQDAVDTIYENYNRVVQDFTNNMAEFSTAINGPDSDSDSSTCESPGVCAAGARVDPFNVTYESVINQFTEGGPAWPAADSSIYTEHSLSYRSTANKFLVIITDANDELAASDRNNDIGEADAINALNTADMPVYVVSGTSTTAVTALADIVNVSGGEMYNYQTGPLATDVSTNWAGDTTIIQDLTNSIIQNVNIFQLDDRMRSYALGPIQTVQRSTDDPEVVSLSAPVTTSLQFLISDNTPVQIDNVSLLPVLEVNKDLPALARSCRAYPESSARQCDYKQPNGTRFNGWKGYCLEKDPLAPQRCITWFPLDVLAGEESIVPRRPSGYLGRSSVYYCLVSKGYQEPGFCEETDFNSGASLAGTFGQGVICTNDSQCSSGTCFKGKDYKLSLGFPPKDSINTQYVEVDPTDPVQNPVSSAYSIRPLRWEMHDPWAVNNWEYGSGVIAKLPANESLRNIHISEIESLIFNTGSAGNNDGEVEFPYWGQLGQINGTTADFTESSANFDTPEEAELGTPTGNCSGSNWSTIGGCDARGNWNLTDLLQGSIQKGDDGNYRPEDNCGTILAGDSKANGAGCRVWGLYDSNFLADYYTGKSETELLEADHGLDLVYTWVWSNFDKGWGQLDDPEPQYDCNLGDAGTDDSLIDFRFGSLNGTSHRDRLFESQCMSPNIAAVLGTTDNNPWENLGDVFYGSGGFYEEDPTDQADAVPFTHDDVANWAGWAEWGDKFAERSLTNCTNTTNEAGDTICEGDEESLIAESSTYGGNIFSLYIDVNDEGYIQNVYTLIYFGAPGTADMPLENVEATLFGQISLGWAGFPGVPFPFSLLGVVDQMQNMNNIITNGGNPSNYPYLVPHFPASTPVSGDRGLDLTSENMMSLRFQVRESCAVVGQAVDESGTNNAWAARTNNGGYEIHGNETPEGFEYGLDDPDQPTIPYSSIGIINELPTHSAWDANPKNDPDNNDPDSDYKYGYYGPQPVVAKNSDDVTAGRPLTCIGKCEEKFCVAEPSAQGQACPSGGGCDTGSCMGVGDEVISAEGVTIAAGAPFNSFDDQVVSLADDARNRLKHIFADMLGFYEMGTFTDFIGPDTDSIYISSPIDFWDDDADFSNGDIFLDESGNSSGNGMLACDSDDDGTPDGLARPQTPGEEAEYCGVYPTVENITFDGNGSFPIDHRYDIANGHTVTLRFTANVDEQQRALRQIYVDWGDGSPVDDAVSFDWNAAPETHIFTHAYYCGPELRNNPSVPNILPETDPWADNNLDTCEFVPRITIVDNWAWCSGTIQTSSPPGSGQQNRYTPDDPRRNVANVCGSYDSPNFAISVDQTQ